MKFISSNNITDPTLNLAHGRICFKKFTSRRKLLLFYINRPSIIVGKNQNTIGSKSDIYRCSLTSMCKKNFWWWRLHHDTGNLNFSFITDDDGNSFTISKFH